MTKLETLEQKAYDQNVKVHDYYLGEESLAGLYINGHVAINTSVKSLRKRTCVIAEELGQPKVSTCEKSGLPNFSEISVIYFRAFAIK